jgi:hypothetical protein
MREYNTTTYQCAEPVWFTEKGSSLRGEQATSLSDEPAGDWWWHLDDGCLHVGPFDSESAALADCLESPALYRSVNRNVSTVFHHGKPMTGPWDRSAAA